MKTKLRNFLWRILGFDYQMLLNKTNYTLLKNDKYTAIGVKTYDNGAKVWRWSTAPLIIGKYCSIAYDVNFIIDEGFHSISPISNFPLLNNLFKENELIENKSKNEFINQFKQKNGISIGNDVWIGMGAFIMPSVTVGNGVVIAANAVVTKNIPDYAIVAGVPAKIIKMKHDDNTIKILNKIAWWNWNEKTIKERINNFHSSIDEFIKKYNT